MQNERLGLPAVAVSSGSFESSYQVAASSSSMPLHLATTNQYNQNPLAYIQNFQHPQALFHQLTPEIATNYHHHHLYNSNLVQKQQPQCTRCQHHYLLPSNSHCPVTDHSVWQQQQQQRQHQQLLGMPTVCSHYGHVNTAEPRIAADQHHLHLHIQQQQHQQQILQQNLITSVQPPVTTNATSSTNETIASPSIRCIPRARVGSVSYSQTAPTLSSSFITRSTSHTALTSDINLPELKPTNGGGSASYQQQDSPLLGSLLTYAPASYTPGLSSSPAHSQVQQAHSPALSSSTATSLPSISPNEALNLGINLEQYISKRNERERSRVRNVNDAFDNLKNSLPLELEKASKRMSKVEILRTAIGYIRNLEQVLGYKKQHQQEQYADASEQAASDDSRDKTLDSKSSSFVPLTQTNQSSQYQLNQATTHVTQTTANKQEPTSENYIDLMRNLEFDQFQDQNY